MSDIVKEAFGKLKDMPLKKRMVIPIELAMVDIQANGLSDDEARDKIISTVNEIIDEWEKDGRP